MAREYSSRHHFRCGFIRDLGTEATRYPTLAPTRSRASQPMRAAAARAAIRRGSSTIDLPPFAHSSAASTRGTRVGFPGPAGRDEPRGVRSAECGSQLGQSGIDGKRGIRRRGRNPFGYPD